MQTTKNNQDFIRLIIVALSVSLGLMTAFLWSVKAVYPRIEFQVTLGTAVAFAAGAISTVLFCRLFFRKLAETTDGVLKERERKRYLGRAVLIFSIVLLLETIWAVVRSLAGVPSEKLGEVIEGTLWALGILAITGVLFWRLTRFIDDGTPQNPPLPPSEPKK